MEKEIKELYAKRAALRSEEKQITAKIKELKLTHIEQTFGFKIGSIITDKYRKTYKITDIEVWDLDMNPHVFKAIPMRKDGTFGTQIRNLWLYEDGIKLLAPAEHSRPFGMVGARGESADSPAGSVSEDTRKEE